MSLVFGLAMCEVRAGWPAATAAHSPARENDVAGIEISVENVDESGEVETSLSTELPGSWTGSQAGESNTEFGSVDTAVSVDELGESGDTLLIVCVGGFFVVSFTECGDDDRAEFGHRVFHDRVLPRR